MAYDFKKECKSLYKPGTKPALVAVPPTPYVGVYGSGDPNQEKSDYKDSIAMLYSIEYTIKMSKKTEWRIPGYFDYVVPPLEGFWWQDNSTALDWANKSAFRFLSCIRLPGFVTQEIFDRAKIVAETTKHYDLSRTRRIIIDEGLCVQCMHVGAYDEELRTIEAMHAFVEKEGYVIDLSDKRRHHEIYLGDPRKCAPEKLKTIIRLPVAHS